MLTFFNGRQHSHLFFFSLNFDFLALQISLIIASSFLKECYPLTHLYPLIKKKNTCSSVSHHLSTRLSRVENCLRLLSSSICSFSTKVMVLISLIMQRRSNLSKWYHCYGDLLYQSNIGAFSFLLLSCYYKNTCLIKQLKIYGSFGFWISIN